MICLLWTVAKPLEVAMLLTPFFVTAGPKAIPQEKARK